MSAPVAGGLDEAVRALMPAARADLERLVALRSVADPSVEPVEECTAAADLVESLLVEAGLNSVKKRPTPDGSLAVFGRTVAPVRGPTVLLYSHYDVQPAGPSDDWGSDPWTLTEREGMSQQELAERLYVTKGNVSGLLDRMVEAGLVERRSIPGDRRSNALYLTAKGRDLANRGMAAQRAYVMRTLGTLPAQDLADLERIVLAWRDRARGEEDTRSPKPR